jgi:hypothetical protein
MRFWAVSMLREGVVQVTIAILVCCSCYKVVRSYCGVARCASRPGDAGARCIASDVLICNDSMALGPGLCSLFRFRNEDRLNFEASLSRDADRPGPFLAGGGGNC